MVWVTLYVQRWRCGECLGEEKLFILFVLHEELFGLKDVVVEFGLVDLKVRDIPCKYGFIWLTSHVDFVDLTSQSPL